MTPVAKTGLHCGYDAVMTPEGRIRHVTPVAKTGLHCGEDSPQDVQVGEFAQVTPVAKTGLHCGSATLAGASLPVV